MYSGVAVLVHRVVYVYVYTEYFVVMSSTQYTVSTSTPVHMQLDVPLPSMRARDSHRDAMTHEAEPSLWPDHEAHGVRTRHPSLRSIKASISTRHRLIPTHPQHPQQTPSSSVHQPANPHHQPTNLAMPKPPPPLLRTALRALPRASQPLHLHRFTTTPSPRQNRIYTPYALPPPPPTPPTNTPQHPHPPLPARPPPPNHLHDLPPPRPLHPQHPPQPARQHPLPRPPRLRLPPRLPVRPRPQPRLRRGRARRPRDGGKQRGDGLRGQRRAVRAGVCARGGGGARRWGGAAGGGGVGEGVGGGGCGEVGGEGGGEGGVRGVVWGVRWCWDGGGVVAWTRRRRDGGNRGDGAGILWLLRRRSVS